MGHFCRPRSGSGFGIRIRIPNTDPDPLTRLNPDQIRIRIRNPEKTPIAPGVIVEAVYDVPAHVEVEGVLGCLVQQVRGLHQLRPEETGLIFKAVLLTRI